jgi:Ras-related protein Rab-2A
MYNYLFKIIIIGDANVGKTCLTLRFINDEYKTSYESTIGVEYGTKIISIKDNRVKLQIWDTAGQEIFKSITKCYYRGASGAILVFDLSNKSTFQNIKKRLNDVKENGSANISIILVGNKSDLQHREVCDQDINEIVTEYNLEYIECSAKQNINIDMVFSKLSEMIYEKVITNNNLTNNNVIFINNIHNKKKNLLKNKCY